ncbi:MAG: pitrilysin family protein [Pirellulales bacterium]
MELLTHKSPGGPEVIALCDPAAFTTSVGWFVGTGARDETPEQAGVSHFLEHMVFKGTERRTAAQVNSELDHLGAQSNAFTSEEETVFHAGVLPECQTQAVDLLTDLMHPSLREEDFETERQVVLEEIAMYDDQPPYGAMERAMELFFGDHSLSRRVLGTAETVSDLSVDMMRAYHAQRYTLDNMFLVASGKVDFERLVEQAESLAGKWRPVGAPRQHLVPKFGADSAIIEHSSTHQQYTIKIWPGVGCNDPARYALRLLSSVIADESGSRLFWELIDTGLAETAALWPQFFDECGCIVGYLCCAPEDTEPNVETMNRVFKDVLAQGITQRELDLARNKMTASLILSDERPGNRLFALGQSWLARRRYDPLDAVLARYQAVTVGDLLETAERTLAVEPTTVQVVCVD